jgi:hypothetical protein
LHLGVICREANVRNGRETDVSDWAQRRSPCATSTRAIRLWQVTREE